VFLDFVHGIVVKEYNVSKMELFPSSDESVRYTVSSVTKGRFHSTNNQNQSITCYTRLRSGFLNGRKYQNFQYNL
jgi:hypothetical protein